jgi:hypothetical protein
MRAEGITMAGEITTELAYPLDTILNEIITGIYQPLPARLDGRHAVFTCVP